MLSAALAEDLGTTTGCSPTAGAATSRTGSTRTLVFASLAPSPSPPQQYYSLSALRADFSSDAVLPFLQHCCESLSPPTSHEEIADEILRSASINSTESL